MSTFDVDRFESRPDPDLICCICHCVLDQPLESPCQHVFCKVCIETWLKNHHSCPSCRKRLKESKLKPALPIIKNMISRLIMKCENFDQGCKAKVQLEHYKKHIESCDFVQISCMNTGCTKVVVRKDMFCHEKECLFRLVPCKRGCGLPVAAKDATGHKCVEELKERLQKLEDSFENYKRDSEMRLVQLENMVADLQNRAQQDSSASDVDQEDDNSRDSPDDDANDPDSDDDDYQSDGGAGGESGDDDEDNGSNNDDEEYDQDSDGGNSGQSYESSSSIEYASDGSLSYRDLPEYDVEDNSDDGDSNDSASVEEIRSTTPPPPPPPPPTQPTVARNQPLSQDLAAFIFSPARGTITPYVPATPGSAPSVPSQQVNTHPALNSMNTRLPPPPPYRPTASSGPSLNMVSVSTDPANTSTRCGMVGLVSTSPGVSVVPTSRPEIKMQLSFQVISRSQSASTVTSTVTRPSSGRPLIPSLVQVSAPIWNNSPSTSTAQGRANRSTLSFATVTSTQTTSAVNRSERTSARPSTTTVQQTPISLRQGTSAADARAALRPLAMGSGSVIASRIPGTRRRRRNVPSRSLPSSSVRGHSLNTPASTYTRRSHHFGQRSSTSLATAEVAATTSLPSSSSPNLSSSYQLSAASQSIRSSQPSSTVGSRPSTSRSVSDGIHVATAGRSVPPAVTVSMTRCRNLMVTTGSGVGSRTVRSSVELGTTTGRASGTAAELQRSLKRSHNDDSSSSDESDITGPPQRVKRVCLPSRKFAEVRTKNKHG